jgi:hypothetical protein
VNFWIVGFDVNFGDDQRGAKAISLEEFYTLVLTSSAKPAAPKAVAAITEGSDKKEKKKKKKKKKKNDGHLFLARSGLVNKSDNPEKVGGEPWTVRGGTFSCVVSCHMAIRKATVNEQAPIEYSGKEIFAKPMKLIQTEALISDLTVTIISIDPKTGKEYVNNDIWGVDRHMKNVPEGLWGECE